MNDNWKVSRLIDFDGVTGSVLINVVTEKVYCHKPSEILIAPQIELEGILKDKNSDFWEQEVAKLDDLQGHYFFNGRLRGNSFKSATLLCAV
nr:hypothetical protein [Aliivibrio fischeri]